jgi:hypothetical protein
MEPGQLMPGLVFTDPADRLQDPHPDSRKVAKAARTFKMAIGPRAQPVPGRPVGAVARDPVHRGDDRVWTLLVEFREPLFGEGFHTGCATRLTAAKH